MLFGKSMNLEKTRSHSSLLSLGSSSEQILNSVIETIQKLKIKQPRIFDVGCGQGELLGKLQNILNPIETVGCDYSNFESENRPKFTFFQHDCNLKLPNEDNSFDLVTSSEVIEHLENPRHFVRELGRVTKLNGYIVISTPNLESYTSIICFFVRGYHSAFGGKAYPAHITAVGAYDLANIIKEVSGLTLIETKFIPNGRIPGLKYYWHRLFPWLKGKRFSDNYLMVIKKTSL